MRLTATQRSLLLAAALTALPTAAFALDEPSASAGTSGIFVPTWTSQEVQTTRVEKRPPADAVGGFQLSVFGGVQLRGSASGTGGIALAYFSRTTAALGLELEAGFTGGPSGEVVHGLLSVILQSGARTARMVPYLQFGVGYYRAQEKLRERIKETFPNFGIDPVEASETGPLVSFGLGIRYYLSTTTSFRAEYREFRAITGADGSLFDRLFSMRRIAGFLSFDF